MADHAGEGTIKTGVVEEAATGASYQDVCGQGEQGVKGTSKEPANISASGWTFNGNNTTDGHSCVTKRPLYRANTTELE